MDLQELKNKSPLLISYMESQNYSRQYISHIKNEIRWILNGSESNCWQTFDDIEQKCIEKYANQHTLKYKRRMLTVIKRFALEFVFPDGSRHTHKPSYYDNLCSDFKCLIDTYRNVIKTKCVKSFHYHKNRECTTCSFLSRLQKQGVCSLEQITEKHVMDIFVDDEKLCRSSHFKSETAAVLKICDPYYPTGICSKILSYLPKSRKIRQNIQYLTKDEIKKIKAVLEDDLSLTRQNRAIGLLAFYTGLRSCDIAALRFDQIDWDNDLIRINQQKTSTPVTLPLRAVVGNAIFEYLVRVNALNFLIILSENCYPIRLSVF